jgi:hypothetical protein
MKSRNLFKEILITFFVAILVGGILSIGTYFWTKEGPNFEIGFPKFFYYQFYKDFLHHGSNLNHFIFDGFLIWGIVACIWFFPKKKIKNVNQVHL